MPLTGQSFREEQNEIMSSIMRHRAVVLPFIWPKLSQKAGRCQGCGSTVIEIREMMSVCAHCGGNR